MLVQDEETLFAETAGQALALVKAEASSAAIVDLDLPDHNGFELIGQMRAAAPWL